VHLLWRDYFELCKPRVVALMTLTAVVAMFLAAPPGELSLRILFYASIGITLIAGSGGVINQLADRHIDAIMARTRKRPLAAGRVQSWQAWVLAGSLMFAGSLLLILKVNSLAAELSLAAMVGYAGIYTLFLKRATPQNIVIGGLAGAMPPLLGWTAVTGHIDTPALLLVLIIFTWTPPHFWALAIHRHADYAKANIPMLPVTHGLPLTRLCILLYTLLMIAMTYFPFIIDAAGLIYLIGVSLLNVIFLYYAVKIYQNKNPRYSYATFKYSIIYLLSLFVLLLLVHFF
jgi:protoheme IX farnesyltransferase